MTPEVIIFGLNRLAPPPQPLPPPPQPPPPNSLTHPQGSGGSGWWWFGGFGGGGGGGGGGDGCGGGGGANLFSIQALMKLVQLQWKSFLNKNLPSLKVYVDKNPCPFNQSIFFSLWLGCFYLGHLVAPSWLNLITKFLKIKKK